jgi:hypothetical protein
MLRPFRIQHGMGSASISLFIMPDQSLARLDPEAPSGPAHVSAPFLRKSGPLT